MNDQPRQIRTSSTVSPLFYIKPFGESSIGCFCLPSRSVRLMMKWILFFQIQPDIQTLLVSDALSIPWTWTLQLASEENNAGAGGSDGE